MRRNYLFCEAEWIFWLIKIPAFYYLLLTSLDFDDFRNSNNLLYVHLKSWFLLKYTERVRKLIISVKVILLTIFFGHLMTSGVKDHWIILWNTTIKIFVKISWLVHELGPSELGQRSLNANLIWIIEKYAQKILKWYYE